MATNKKIGLGQGVVGAPRSVLSGVCSYSGFDRRDRRINPQTRVTVEQLKELREKYVAGAKVSELAKEYMVTEDTARKLIGHVFVPNRDRPKVFSKRKTPAVRRKRGPTHNFKTGSSYKP